MHRRESVRPIQIKELRSCLQEGHAPSMSFKMVDEITQEVPDSFLGADRVAKNDCHAQALPVREESGCVPR